MSILNAKDAYIIGEIRYLCFKTIPEAHTALEKLPRGWVVLVAPYKEDIWRVDFKPYAVIVFLRYEGLPYERL